MRLLVTGADGFIGARACDLLESRGHDVVRVVRNARGQGRNRRVVADLVQLTDWSTLLLGIDTVLHLAGRAHVLNEKEADAELAFQRVNVEVTRRLAASSAELGVRRLVFASSIGVNGACTEGEPFREEDEPRPQNAYARSKLDAERALLQVAGTTSLELAIVRPPLIYGPGAKGNLLRMLKLVSSGLPVPLRSLRNRRNLVSLDNLCDALALCCEAQAAAGQTFLLAEPEPRSTADIFAALYRGMGRTSRLLPVPSPLLQAAARLVGKSDLYEKLCGSLELDATKARRLLGWQPRDSFEVELARTARWYLNRARTAC